LDDCGLEPSVLAALFRNRALRRGRDVPKDNIESHVSHLAKGEPSAIRFFFTTPADADDLLDILGVPKKSRASYLRDCSPFLQRQETRIRVVVDLSDQADGREMLDVCDELADKIMGAAPFVSRQAHDFRG
jgi:hypothetical protein